VSWCIWQSGKLSLSRSWVLGQRSLPTLSFLFEGAVFLGIVFFCCPSRYLLLNTTFAFPFSLSWRKKLASNNTNAISHRSQDLAAPPKTFVIPRHHLIVTEPQKDSQSSRTKQATSNHHHSPNLDLDHSSAPIHLKACGV
jgi:hypothetical protein